ncbi:HAMP domain-containing sensor histidine kinase [Cytophagaceae bacterium YF14B1]|uniref:histidine kinase n=1 Tax=Xanthocytophaga flava TaxID=3048013 RepID=A0AAE3U646_9BACT|nr:HAMP domain-containing sensor histidine kinase [Xanthocytophaga flavus]MDJ1480976.1 HAMP domain-containing sensor histidine kinase [Xanthocytophaga flavus]
MKIRTRIAYLFAVIVASLLLVFSVGIYYFSADYREREFYERLREKAITTARLLYESNQKITPQTLKLIDEQDKVVLFEEKVTVFDDKNNLIYYNHPYPEPIDPHILSQIYNARDKEIKRRKGEVESLYKYYPEKEKNLIVVVSAIDQYGLSKQNFLITILSVGWFVGVLVIVFAGWVFAGNALEPIADVIFQVEQIDSTTLDKRRVQTENDKDEIAQLAQTFNRMLDRLQESFYIQKSFVANASHELRTPLTAMRGQIEVTLLYERENQEYMKLLKSLYEDVTGMTDLTNELLDLAHASSDLTTLPFEKKRIDEIVLQAEAELLRKKPDYDVILDFAEPPEEEEYFELVVNERLLKNAFINIMENACKFSPDHTVSIKIFFQEDRIMLQFTDKGIGIPEAEIPYIFEPFFRSKNANNISGHGLGLPLTAKIIEIHQGRIQVFSVVNEGTTFIITLFRKEPVKKEIDK